MVANHGSAPSRPTASTDSVYFSSSTTAPTGVRTTTPSPEATSGPPNCPAAPGVSVTSTEAVPPAGTTTDEALSENGPAGGFNASVTGAAEAFEYVTVRVTGPEAGHATNGNDKEEGDDVTDCPRARATS